MRDFKPKEHYYEMLKNLKSLENEKERELNDSSNAIEEIPFSWEDED